MFFTLFASNGKTQQITSSVICTGGEAFFNNGYYIDFTIGEIMTETFTSSKNLLSQGFLQGIENNIGIKELTAEESEIIIYPNPAVNHIYIFNNNSEIKPVSIDIANIQGKVVLRQLSISHQKYFDIEKLTPGLYIISIQFNNRQIINKKLVKQ
jgi:hypothetical protein